MWGSWPDPKDLPSELLPVEPFDFDLMPWSLKPWIEDVADRVQCPPDFPAIGAMVSVAAIVGRKIGIRPKQYDDWLVVPNLWGAVIGRPGIMKTPALQEVVNPIRRLEIAAGERFKEQEKEMEARRMVDKERKNAATRDIKAALKRREDAYQVARDILDEECEEPTRRRYMTNDPTVEKLGEILNENPNGVQVFRDELMGLLKSLDREGREGSRAFYLEAWNGTGRYTYDRVGRGTLDIEATILSILGGIQPGPLSEYLHKASQNGAGDDGLLQRFQLMVWPDVSTKWKNVDRWPDTGAGQTAYSMFKFLDDLDPRDIGAETDQFGEEIPFVRFDPEAQSRFDDWRGTLEQRVRSGDLHPVIESHLAKYRSLIPSLALLMQLADGGGSVGIESLDRAIAWARYLESHANRIYGSVTLLEVTAAKTLAKKITEGALENGFGLRDVYRRGWAGLKERDAAQEAIDVLCDLDWLEAKEISANGRPKVEYLINPKITQKAQATD